MTEMLKVEIDISNVMSVLKGLSERSMQNAWRRTLRKTGNWIKGQVAKSVGKGMKIPQKLLKQRVYFFLRSKDSGKVWLGLNDIEAERLGAPRQTRFGVTAGRHRFKSAWINKKRVFRRKGRSRTPYERVKVDWSGPGEAAFREVIQMAEQRLMTVLQQEVKYELHKAIKNVH